jgi:hypothetical protein
MKHLYLLATLVLFSFIARSQDIKLEIACEVSDYEIKYSRLEKYLPESLQSHLIRLKRSSRPEALDLINMMTLSGWKLVTAAPVISSNSVTGASSRTIYLLKKELVVTEAEHKEILNRLKKDMR